MIIDLALMEFLLVNNILCKDLDISNKKRGMVAMDSPGSKYPYVCVSSKDKAFMYFHQKYITLMYAEPIYISLWI